MALAVVPVRPNATLQMGSSSNSVVGAASADVALADNSDASYVQLASRCRLDSDVIRVGFPTPPIPAGARVYSVGLRRRIQTVVVTDPREPPPVCHHWLRCLLGLIEVAGQLPEPRKTFFSTACPTSPVVSEWKEEDLGTLTTAPGGQPWDPATNLTNLTYDIGRGDDGLAALRVSAVFLDITYQQASSVTVTGPTGSTTATRPTISWTYSSPDSQPQQSYRTAVYTAEQVAQPGFVAFAVTPVQASGWTPGTPWSSTAGWLLGEDLQWALTSDLTDGQYRAFVQARSRWPGVGEFPTEVASTTWTRAATPVNPPPPAALTSVVFEPAANRVRLTFAPGGSSPPTTAFTVRASRDNGLTWVDIPRLTYLPANGANPVTDYDYAFYELNAETRYRVVSYNGSVLNASTAPSNELSVTPTGDQHFLKHPSNPLLNTVLPLAAPKPGEGIKVTERQVQGIFRRIGGAGSTMLPIVVSGPSNGLEYELEALFVNGEPSFDYYRPVVQLQRSGSVLLWQRPDGNTWVSLGPGIGGRDTEETYDAVPGSPRKVGWRRRKLTMTEQEPPIFY